MAYVLTYELKIQKVLYERYTISVRWNIFTLLYGKFIQSTVYVIKISPKFYTVEDMTKTFWRTFFLDTFIIASLTFP